MSMNKKNILIPIIILILCCLLGSSFSMLLAADFHAKSQYRLLSELSRKMISKYPDSEQEIIRLIKSGSYYYEDDGISDQDYLSAYGFEPKDFAMRYLNQSYLFAAICMLLFLLLLFLLFRIIRKRYRRRIYGLTEYLEKINTDKSVSLLPSVEDVFSPLQDEIYKTLTNLRQTKDAAIEAKKNFADNLANISHQIKTPITSVFIMTQLLKNEWKEDYVEQIRKQALRLEQMAGALLTLSRIDAGVLKLERKQIDIYTMLQLSADALEEIIGQKEIKVTLPNHPGIMFQGDLEWSMEAFMNLIKNCAEHTPDKGEISLDYSQNPLYSEILVKDSGEGFSKKDLLHAFERFYRGERASKTGIGIGLSLARSIIEMQNGLIYASNLPEGGACFTVRFYSH
jgi:signal transduction histidine kinase